jgi:hypothetical protein
VPPWFWARSMWICASCPGRPNTDDGRPAIKTMRAGSIKGVGAGSRDGWPGCGGAVTLSGMPFKHNAARRHRIPKARYRVQNWPAYEVGLKRRGDLTLWLEKAALAG